MAAKRGKAAQRRREQIVEIVSSLPEVDVSGEQHLAFRIRKKTFGYYLDDHHGDGIVGLALKAAPGDANALAARHPSRYYLPDYLGPKGWLGLRIDGPKIDWAEVSDRIVTAYRLQAPKTLARRLE